MDMDMDMDMDTGTDTDTEGTVDTTADIRRTEVTVDTTEVTDVHPLVVDSLLDSCSAERKFQFYLNLNEVF